MHELCYVLLGGRAEVPRAISRGCLSEGVPVARGASLLGNAFWNTGGDAEPSLAQGLLPSHGRGSVQESIGDLLPCR